MRTRLTRTVVCFGLVGGVSVTALAVSHSPLDDSRILALTLQHLEVIAPSLSLQDPAAELRPRRVVRDEIGQIHVRLDQVHDELPVFGQQLIVHLNAGGSFRAVNGALQIGIATSTTPSLPPLQAETIAAGAFPGSFTRPADVELMLLPRSPHGERVRLGVTLRQGEVVLAYRVVLKDAATPRRIVVFVDATTGHIVESANDLHTVEGSGQSLYIGTVSITTSPLPFKLCMPGPFDRCPFQLVDLSRGRLRTSDLDNVASSSKRGRFATDADNMWGDGTVVDRTSAEVDVHFGAEKTWDYYRSVLGRDGIGDDGVGPLLRTHYGVRYPDAFFDDDFPNQVTFGDGGDADGDGVDDFKTMVSLDIVAHELTHGVTHATAGLVYTNQPGGLNEAMSDIFGTMVEFFAADHGAMKAPNYQIGEDVCVRATTFGGFLRRMDSPLAGSCFNMLKVNGCRTIDTFADYVDGMDPHCSSGIANNAFYLLAEGGTHRLGGKVTGIGREEAGRIFYRALRVYMIPSESFGMARSATVMAARDLFGSGSPEIDSMTAAWSAVGVL